MAYNFNIYAEYKRQSCQRLFSHYVVCRIYICNFCQRIQCSAFLYDNLLMVCGLICARYFSSGKFTCGKFGHFCIARLKYHEIVNQVKLPLNFSSMTFDRRPHHFVSIFMLFLYLYARIFFCPLARHTYHFFTSPSVRKTISQYSAIHFSQTLVCTIFHPTNLLSFHPIQLLFALHIGGRNFTTCNILSLHLFYTQL